MNKLFAIILLVMLFNLSGCTQKDTETDISVNEVTTQTQDDDSLSKFELSLNDSNLSSEVKNGTDGFIDDNNNVPIYIEFNNHTLDSISLINAEDSSIVATLYDDGNGIDVSSNDGIFSANLNISLTEELYKNFNVYVEYTQNGNIVQSNNCDIFVYRNLTDLEIAETEAVDNIIWDFMNSKEYDLMSLEERKEKCYQILTYLAINGTAEYPYSLIDIDSIYFDDDHWCYSYSYKSTGIQSGIILKPFDSDCN